MTSGGTHSTHRPAFGPSATHRSATRSIHSAMILVHKMHYIVVLWVWYLREYKYPHFSGPSP
ncbi:hypothetical protein BV22DRAFT_756416 [Leucogyrophana mollusca]|uniref:Uncharacterized protein n=1 Tax=Leucogyrophana mollusca TaxID=85980 RepID=A0ACB8B6A0_9AGAM|nr:hypothetical protein BV22DRAFT_756416 [Leucogyrophana mollusca]